MDREGALAAAAAFGVRADDAVELSGGYVNEVWLTAPQRAVVRAYGRLHVSRHALRFEHSVIQHAAQKIRMVAPPRTDPQGRTFRLIGGAFVAVFAYIEGSTGDRGAQAGAACAQALAAFHRAMADFHPGTGARAVRSLGILPWFRERILRLSSDRLLARSVAWDDVLQGCADATVGIAGVGSTLPILVVHGDPHPDNFVIENGAVRGLLDFDFAHETERVYDVATAIDAFSREDEDAPLDIEAGRALARAYHAAAPLTPEEWYVIPDMMLRRNAALVWHVVNAHSARRPGDVGNAARYVARINEIRARAHELRGLGPRRTEAAL